MGDVIIDGRNISKMKIIVVFYINEKDNDI